MSIYLSTEGQDADNLNMLERVVEIADEGRSLTKVRGSLRISADGENLGTVPLDDVAVLMLTARSAFVSKNALVALAENGAVVTLCGANFVPVAITLPFAHNAEAASRIHTQMGASLPLRKSLWRSLIQRKIRNQALVLSAAGAYGTASHLKELSKAVESGDPKNREAQAARMYWPALMGQDFRRNKNLDGDNARLNYGYAVLRAMFARAVCAAGLLPGEGLHHSTRDNFALADDLMEPYRPFVDWIVLILSKNAEKDMNPNVKRKLASIMSLVVSTEKGLSPLSTASRSVALSLCSSFKNRKNELQLPCPSENPEEWYSEWTSADTD